MVRTLANDTDVQFRAVVRLAIVVPGPVITNLMAGRLLGSRWSHRGGLAGLVLCVEANGGEKVWRDEKWLLVDLEGIAPLHEAHFKGAKHFIVKNAYRCPLITAG